MRFVGFLLLVLLVGWGVTSGIGDRYGILISPSSLLGVWGGAAFILLMSHGKQEWYGFFRVIRFKTREMDEESKKVTGGFLETASRAALGMGVFWVIFGIVVMMMNMDDPAAIGPGLAMLMLPLLYGIVLSEMVLVPMRKNLMRSGKKTAE